MFANNERIPQRGKMNDLAKLKQGLADAQREVRNLTLMAMKPDLTPAKA